ARRVAGAIAIVAASLALQITISPVALAAHDHHVRGRASACRHRHRHPPRCRRGSPPKHHPPSTSAAPASPPAPPSAGKPTASCVDTTLIPTSGNTSQIAAATLCLVNAERARRGEVALRDNADLDVA